MNSALNLVLRLAWFYLAGLWIGIAWLFVAWLACLTIVGLPLGVWMVNKAPLLMTLRESGQWRKVQLEGRTAYVFEQMESPSFLVRLIWFVLIGWWASFAWGAISLSLAFTFLGLPIAFWMFNQLPWVMTLSRG